MSAMFVNGSTWVEASMKGPLLRLLILFRSVNKHGRQRQFLFLLFDFYKYSPLKPLGNRGPFIDASTQVSIHLAKRFQR
jgi:hypothetical protein